jgi:predicted kinase
MTHPTSGRLPPGSTVHCGRFVVRDHAEPMPALLPIMAIVLGVGKPLLVVLAGRPGTGKTTLARRLATELTAAYLRIDAIEAAVVRCALTEHPVGLVGYVVAHELAAGTLSLGTPVVVDAVNPVPEARSGWRSFAGTAQLVVFETTLSQMPGIL